MSAGKYAQTVEGDGVIVEDYLDIVCKAGEGDAGDDDAGVGFVDGQMWLLPATLLDCVEDGGFVGAQDFGILVRHAGMVDVEEERRRGQVCGRLVRGRSCCQGRVPTEGRSACGVQGCCVGRVLCVGRHS